MRRSRFQFLWHVPLLLAAATMVIPLVFMITTALSGPDAMKGECNLREMLIPRGWHWDTFLKVWSIIPFLHYYANSLFVALAVTAAKVFTSACAAYAFSRLTWPGRNKLFLAYLGTMMVPGAVTMLPNFVTMKMLPEVLSHLIPCVDWSAMRYIGTLENHIPVGRLVGLDSYFALIAPGAFSAYGTFMLRQFLISLPKELDEAAKIDGCTHWQIFTRVTLPLALPALATLTIFTFMGTWGSLLWPLVVTTQPYLRTLPLALQLFQGQYGPEWHLMMAAGLMMLLPNVFIFLLGQRFFLAGLTVGSVKG